VGKILAERGVRKGVGTGPQYRHKQRSWPDFYGFAIIDRNRRPGPVDEDFFARTVILAKNQVLRAAPPLVELTKTAITVSSRLAFAILLPEQLQSHMLVALQLLMDGGTIQRCLSR